MLQALYFGGIALVTVSDKVSPNIQPRITRHLHTALITIIYDSHAALTSSTKVIPWRTTGWEIDNPHCGRVTRSQ